MPQDKSATCADDGAKDAMAAQPHQRLHQEFPATRLQFVPSAAAAQRDLVAASSDCLRVWHLTEGGSTFEKLLDVRLLA